VEYSRFIRDFRKPNASLNLDVAKEISNRIIDNTMPLMPSQVESDTIRNHAIYQFTFQLLEVIQVQRKNGAITSETEQAIDLFINMLHSKKVDTGTKYIILSSFVNSDRGGATDIHFRLQSAFETMMHFKKDEILEAIRYVFKEVDERYLTGNEIIYEKEDNFFYVLYQSWSGKKDNVEELQKIHEASARGLENHLEAIRLYWSKIPAPQNARNYDEAVEDEHTFGYETREFNITLAKLIEISEKRLDDFSESEKWKIKLWKDIINNKEDSKKYYERCSVKDSIEPLASFLIRKEYLADWGRGD